MLRDFWVLGWDMVPYGFLVLKKLLYRFYMKLNEKFTWMSVHLEMASAYSFSLSSDLKNDLFCIKLEPISCIINLCYPCLLKWFKLDRK